MIRPRQSRRWCAPLAGAFCLFWVAAAASDWPQFLGPQRNGSTQESVGTNWPGGTPGLRWKAKVGSGFAGPAVAGDKVLIFHRQQDHEVLSALAANTGKPLWEERTPTDYADDFGFDDGPRAVPAVRDGRVVTLGAAGRLTCRNLTNGAALWEVDTRTRFQTGKGFFGVACSPLIADGLVLLNLGGRDDAGVAAFAVDSGRLVWKHTGHEAGYASPVPARIKDRPWGIFFTREGLVGVELATGKLGFTFPWRARMSASVNAASPLVVGSQLFATSSYGVGAVLLELRDDGPRSLWANDESLSAHYATPVEHAGFLYGFHGRQESGPALRCVEWSTGKVRWSEEGFGAGTLAVAGSHLVVLRETGELVVAAASPESFRPLARAQILGANRAVFALADGALYARDKGQLVSIDLRTN